MPSLEELVPLADASAFIFTGSIARAGASTVPVIPADAATAVVSVEEVIKIPLGLRGFAGREVTVGLLHPLEEGRYVFFADPMSVGNGIALRERAHFDASERGRAAEAVERGYARLIERRAEAAFLVALGTEGAVRPLLTPAERYRRVPWAVAPFEIERVLKGEREFKGKGKARRITLVGPFPASKRLPRTPGLRAGRRAILFLQRPPEDAIDLIPEEERQGAAFIADTSDIQPPERLETILHILGRVEKEI
jgi:hypothetical protein